MKIAFIHYHLKPGGVTSVLHRQVRALSDTGQALVIVGEAPPAEIDLQAAVIDGLGYDSPNRPLLPPQQIAEAIQKAIATRFGGPCDLIHVHNPTLAKNRQLLAVLKILQQWSPLLLQIHDFAEDGRPNAYCRQAYPADCHYAVINRRDHQLLAASGLSSAGLHILPNSVTAQRPAESRPPFDNYALYPIRALRRKNIGEALLISRFFKEGETLAVTLPPNSPVDLASYRDWKTFAAKQRLAVRFDVGLVHDFRTLLANARYIMTTSITEGFGFVFLEPWLAGKRLWGRRLPEICADFAAAGIVLDHLYPSLKVPTRWIDAQAFAAQWLDCMRQVCRQYGHPLPPTDIEASCRSLIEDGTIDFGLLNESFQKDILRRVGNGRRVADELRGLNPFLAHPGRVADSTARIEANRRQILAHFNDRQYRQRLLNIYRRVVDTPVRHRIDKQRLLDFFLRPDRFSLLKWCRYAG